VRRERRRSATEAKCWRRLRHVVAAIVIRGTGASSRRLLAAQQSLKTKPIAVGDESVSCICRVPSQQVHVRLLSRPKKLYFCLFVFACWQDNSKSCGRILINVFGWGGCICQYVIISCKTHFTQNGKTSHYVTSGPCRLSLLCDHNIAKRQ